MTNSRLLRGIAIGVATVALILVLGFLVSALVSEPGPVTKRLAGVAIEHGEVSVRTCSKHQIGVVVIQNGRRADGPTVWRATWDGSLGGRTNVPISGRVIGYEIMGLSELRPDQTYAVQQLDDTGGRGLLRSYIVFKPAEIPEGSIALSGGRIIPIGEWLASSDCH